ncbi:gluconokinase [Desulfosporosinus fructosivorans]|uniref:gluconokinase n=1 Tax=Desulfosporosinus fructosivorans TaxID=2018669 RepID=UPI00130D9445|nr:gluconokinase [Desulfosporosinus fructosivorans]
MKQRESILSVDVGTSSVKVTIFNGEVELVRESSISYPLLQTQSGFAEQDPQRILEAFHQAIQQVLSGSENCPNVMVLSTAMHSLVAIDEFNKPITQLVTWADQRAEGQASQLRSSSQGNSLYQRTGTPIHAMSPLLKLAWFRDNEPEIFERAKLWADLKSLILFDLLGEWLIDESLASATGLYNLLTRDWDQEAMRWCGVTREQLPRLVRTTNILGCIRPELTDQLGIAENIRVVAGASDGALANLGVGAVYPGSLAISIGTSGAVRGMVNEPKLDPHGRLFCYHVDKSHYIVGGPINNGGILLRWLQGILLERGEPSEGLISESKLTRTFYELMSQGVNKVAPGSDGLFCLPYLTGERAPFWREDLSGSFWGLKLNHNRDHLVRAVLEGICYQLNSVVELLTDLTGPVSEIRATGGFTKSEVWLKILADVLGKSLGVLEHAQGSALGGAFLAWYALGQINSLEECAELVPIAHVERPDEARIVRYQDGYKLFKELVILGDKAYLKLQEFAQKGESL